jgi:dipeptidyl aminopeptidase/acylaminoacyl peptidase
MLSRLALVALLGLALQVQARPELVKPGPQLLADGIPVFARAPRTEARQEPPAYRFADWHPVRREMLILGRIGGTGGVTQLQRLSAPGAAPQPLSRGSDAVNAARWEPAQGRYLVFSRDQRGDEAYRLYRLADGEAEQQSAPVLTPAGERVNAFEFLPDGQGLVYLLERLDRQAQPGLDGGARRSRSRLMWQDPLRPESERELGVVEGGRYTGLRVAPSGAILLTETRAGKSQLLRFALDGKPGRPLGAALRPEELDEEDWVWTRQASRGDFRHLVRLDAASGERLPLLSGAAADLEALAVPPRVDGRPLALVSNEAGLSVLRVYDPARPELAPRRVAEELPGGVLRAPRWHERRAELGFDHVSAASPGRIYSWSLADGRLQAWTPGEEGGAAAPAFGLLRWKSFDGREISGLHTPPAAGFKGRRPVYIQIHGGPSAQARPGYLSATLRQLVEQQGMHVIQPNVRGSEGFGREFLALDNGRRREDAVRDISALLDLIATREDMDPARVIVAGGSYGGYMALAVAVHESARIAGSICRVGIANFISFLEQTESYRRDNRRAEYGDERDPEMREFLRSISPLTRAAEVRKPLFVVHGRNDPRVPHAEAQQMVAAVRAQGTPVWFLTAEDEGHSFVRSANRDYLAQATAEFVRRVLAGEPLAATP